MFSQKELKKIKNFDVVLGQGRALQYLHEADLPPKGQIVSDLIGLVLIHQELTAELQKIRQELLETEEARQCAFLTIAFLERQIPKQEKPKSKTKLSPYPAYRKSA